MPRTRDLLESPFHIMHASASIGLLLLGNAHALVVPTSSTSRADRAAISSRRAILGNAANVAAAAAAAAIASPAFAKDKGYMTMDEYNNIKKQAAKDEKLYGLFENLRERARQTGEFDKLAAEDKLKDISPLALAWDSNIRKELLDKANESLTGADKEKGSALSKAINEDLKKLDKLAKAGDKDGVPELSASLRTKVLDFVALEPQRLQDRFGVGDL